MFHQSRPSHNSFDPTKPRVGFSLVEVVLAIGIFLVTVLALVGLLGPTLQSVDEVEKTDEIASVVNTVNAFLQSSPKIAVAAGSKFDAIFNAVADGDSATLFVFRRYLDSTSTDIRLAVGFDPQKNQVNTEAHITPQDFANAAGPVYRVVLTPSSVLPILPVATRSSDRNPSTGTYTLATDLAGYKEGYFAMEVRIYDEAPPGPNATFDVGRDLTELVNIEPLFIYNTAIVR